VNRLAHPAVTAVIPAHNKEAFIGRTLASALGQTYPHLEIIVVDDGSTDGTRAIAERLAAEDERVRVISVVNSGVAAARNLGTSMATTPYVAYLDADDLWHPEKIARQVAELAKHGHQSEWVGCYALSRFIDLADRVLGNGPSADARGDFFERHLYRNHLENGSCLLVRRDVALEVGGFDPGHAERGLGGLEDYEFQLKLLRRYKLEVVREFLVGYRVYPGQMSDDLVRMARAHVMTLEEILPDCALPAAPRARALAFVRLVAAYRELRAGAWRRAAADVAWTFGRAPIATLRLVAELVGIRFKRRKRAWTGASEPELLPFAELAPTDGVAATDDLNARPRARLAAMRLRSAARDQAAEAPASHMVTDRSARFAR
jgi:glycosyltransferase involved in cell wall biosynthesis